MSNIRKAIVPVAGHGIRMLPISRAFRKAFFPIPDSEGLVKPVIQLIIEEAISGGIEEICLVTTPEDKEIFRSYFSSPPDHLKRAIGNREIFLEAAEFPHELADRLTYVIQENPLGFGDAVLKAKSWSGNEPFLVMLGDHLYLSKTQQGCTGQLLERFNQIQAPISGLIQKPLDSLKDFGTVSGIPIENKKGLYKLDTIIEKPNINKAKKYLRMKNIPIDYFLCWFGLHAMTQDLFGFLEQIKKNNMGRGQHELQLTSAQSCLCADTDYFGLEINGNHFDTGSPKGFVDAVAKFGNLKKDN